MEADPQTRAFFSDTPVSAMRAADEWINNSTEHGPIRIVSIDTDREDNVWISTVNYRLTTEPGPSRLLYRITDLRKRLVAKSGFAASGTKTPPGQT